MIRRGLQLLAVVGLLGAAPLHAQSGFAWPNTVVIQNMSYPAGQEDPNGLYVMVGGESFNTSGGFYFRRWSDDGSTIYQVEIRWLTDGRIRHYLLKNGAFVAMIGDTMYKGDNLPQSYGSWGSFGSTGYTAGQVIWQAAPTAEQILEGELEDAFPDWNSASTMIPLGFTFAMAFWASATALTIGMKWAKELASVAS